jgi:hypothetical protein
MSRPSSDPDYKPKKMRHTSPPKGIEPVRCWCGDICKVRMSDDFSDKFGMKFWMCANYAHDPATPKNAYDRPPV